MAISNYRHVVHCSPYNFNFFNLHRNGIALHVSVTCIFDNERTIINAPTTPWFNIGLSSFLRTAYRYTIANNPESKVK